jgi:hypothetical protein
VFCVNKGQHAGFDKGDVAVEKGYVRFYSEAKRYVKF